MYAFHVCKCDFLCVCFDVFSVLVRDLCVICEVCVYWLYACFVVQILDVSVQPVEVHIAVCCIICSLVMFVVDAIGDNIVEAYSNIGLVMALYVKSNVSLCLTQLFEERTLSIGILLDALAAMLSMCL